MTVGRIRTRPRGFTLLEVLVALVVLSIGLLGLAGLQLTSVVNTRDAYQRTQALMLSYDITDRMRANLGGVEAGDYDQQAGTVVASCKTSAGCTTAQLAADDVAAWRTTVSDVLAGGDAIVCIDSSPDDGDNQTTHGCDGAGSHYVVKVWWNNDRDAATENYRLVTVFMP